MVHLEKIEELREEYKDLAVVCYINSTAEIKTYSDVCVTSANAVKVVKNLPNKHKMIGFASAEGLAPNPDNLHFSAPALREFGLRYYEAFLKLEDKDKVFEEKPDELGAIRSEIEYL